MRFILAAICLVFSLHVQAQSDAVTVEVQSADFFAAWRRAPSEALPYLLDQWNKSQQLEAFANNVRYELSYGEMNEPFRIEPKIHADHLAIAIQIHPRLRDNPIALFEILTDLRAISFGEFSTLIVQVPLKDTGRHLPKSVFEVLSLDLPNYQDAQSALQWAELKLNAKAGNAAASLELARFESSTRMGARVRLDSFLTVSEFTDREMLNKALVELGHFRKTPVSEQSDFETNWRIYLETYLAGTASKEAQLLKLAGEEFAKSRKASAQLNDLKKSFESQAVKFDEMVKSNDREGVAKLLELYMPWNEMGAIEKGLWLNWVDSIRRPNLRDSVILYRGIGEGEPLFVTADESGAKDGRAMVSTVLSKNQGNYTRRLRSLTTMRYRLGFRKSPTNPVTKTPMEISPKVTSMMINHARDPVGSAFLSFTTKASTAFGFAGRETLAVRVDRRRVLPNIQSGLKHEMEMLVPLLIFPDEVIAHTRAQSTRANIYTFEAEVLAKSQLTGAQLPTAIAKGAFADAYRIFSEAARRELSGPACKAAFH